MKRDKGTQAKRIMNACNKRDRDELSEVLSEMSSTDLLEMIVVCGMNTSYVWEVLNLKVPRGKVRNRKSKSAG